MVSISQKLVVSYKASLDVTIPNNLIHSEGNDKFLKIQVSHPVICKLSAAAAAGKLDIWKACKNPSLSSSSNYGILKEKLCQAVQEASAPEDKEEKDIFAGNVKQGNAKQGKPTLEKCPDKVEMDVDGCKVQVLCPQSWKQYNLWVLMDPGMLAAVFAFLGADVESCFQAENKRSYNKRKLAED